MSHPHKLKTISSTKEKEVKKHSYVYRLVPLLLLTFYSIVTVLRIPNSADLVVTTSDTTEHIDTRTRDDLESLKTHLPSNQDGLQVREERRIPASLPCSALINGEAEWSGSTTSHDEQSLLCCDRTHYRSDVCYLRGDVRTDPETTSVFLYNAPDGASPEKIRPYTRKFEKGIMKTINRVTIVPVPARKADNATRSMSKRCDVLYPKGVTAVVFSTGGYTGNVYHEFNDGLIPLYVTAQRFHGEVVFVILEYHYWWLHRYSTVLERMTNYKIVDFNHDRRVHCFSEMIVGMRIHGELVVDAKLMPNGNGIQDFQQLLHQGYGRNQPERQPLPLSSSFSPCLDYDEAAPEHPKTRPRLEIFIRKKNRALLNLKEIVTACRHMGFQVHVLNVMRATPLPQIHKALVAADVMVAVHGAAITHFLFMRPGTVLLQVVPIGLDWAADAYYGTPAQKLGLQYLEYKVAPEESSLAAVHGVNSSVLQNPSEISSKGWWEMKKVYMDKQNVTVNIKRLSELLKTARLQLMNSTCSKGIS